MVNLHTAANFLRNRPRPILVAGLIAMVGALFLFGGTAAVSIGVIVIAMQAAIVHESRDTIATLKGDLEILERRAVYEDPQTGLGNRRQLQVACMKQIARYRRWHEPFALALLEFANPFRPDRPLSDEALSGIAQALLDVARTEDTVCRIDGQTFAIVLTQTGEAGAIDYVDRVRVRLSEQPVKTSNEGFFTIYSGEGSWAADMETPFDLLSEASRNLQGFRDKQIKLLWESWAFSA